MKKISNSLIVVAFLITIGYLASCTSDTLAEPEACDTLAPTYSTNVKQIIDQTCAYSGCHDGAGGIGPGNYTNMEGLSGILQTGRFEERVINSADNPSLGMPPNASVYPESLQDDLTEAQLEIITCWVQAGFPE